MTRTVCASDRDHGLASQLEEERACLLAWQQDRDQRALERVIRRAQPRVRALARRISAAHAEDLVAEGYIALTEAAQRYRPQGSVPFYGYAFRAVRGAMLSAYARLQTGVSISERRLRDGLSGRLGAELRDELSALAHTEGFDETRSAAGSPAAEELTIGVERHAGLRRALAGALRPLTRAERQMIVHHLLHEDRALEALALDLGLPLARARQIEGRALQKMRNTLLQSGYAARDLI